MMMRWMTIGLVVLGMVAPALGQMRDFGEVPVSTRESFEAGIRSLLVVRSGPEEQLEECSIAVDVLAESGGVMGVSEIRFPGEDLIEQTFVSSAGDSFFLSANEATGRIVFEHVGGDRFTVTRPSCDAPEEFPRTKEAYEQVLRELRKCYEQVEISGTSKTFQEASADNQEAIGLMTAVLGEIRRFLDVPTRGERETRRKATEQARSQSSGASSIPTTDYSGNRLLR